MQTTEMQQYHEKVLTYVNLLCYDVFVGVSKAPRIFIIIYINKALTDSIAVRAFVLISFSLIFLTPCLPGLSACQMRQAYREE